jgi:hypothetical protein
MNERIIHQKNQSCQSMYHSEQIIYNTPKYGEFYNAGLLVRIIHYFYSTVLLQEQAKTKVQTETFIRQLSASPLNNKEYDNNDIQNKQTGIALCPFPVPLS